MHLFRPVYPCTISRDESPGGGVSDMTVAPLVCPGILAPPVSHLLTYSGYHQVPGALHQPAHSSVGRDPVQAHLRHGRVAQSGAIIQTCLQPCGTFHPSLQALTESADNSAP